MDLGYQIPHTYNYECSYFASLEAGVVDYSNEDLGRVPLANS